MYITLSMISHFPGDLHLFLVADYYHKSVSCRHANHLRIVLSKPEILRYRRTVIILADNGPDWAGDTAVNLLYFGRLWRDLQLDRLIIIHYSASYSRFNYVERRWCMCSFLYILDVSWFLRRFAFCFKIIQILFHSAFRYILLSKYFDY